MPFPQSACPRVELDVAAPLRRRQQCCAHLNPFASGLQRAPFQADIASYSDSFWGPRRLSFFCIYCLMVEKYVGQSHLVSGIVPPHPRIWIPKPQSPALLWLTARWVAAAGTSIGWNATLPHPLPYTCSHVISLGKYFVPGYLTPKFFL